MKSFVETKNRLTVMTRSQKIIRTSIIGIAANVLLASFRAVVGMLASSVAIVMDHNYSE